MSTEFERAHEYAEISSLKYYPDNPRISDIHKLARSLGDGQFEPVVVQKSTRYILAGNHRVQAAQEVLGWSHVDAWIIDVDDDQAREIVIKSNRLGEISTYDPVKNAELLNAASEAGADVEALGYDFGTFTETLLAARKAEGEPETWGEEIEVPVEVYQSMSFKVPVRYAPLVEATIEAFSEGNLPGAESKNVKGWALIRLCEAARDL